MRVMNLKIFGAILTLTATLLLGFTFVGPVEAQYPGYGPASPEMKLFYYADETALYSAFKAGSIDLSLWEATSAQYRDAITDPNIILDPVSRLDMRAFSLNNNETIATYPGVRIATSYADFRKALWCMVDRAYYTEVICGGFATPVYVMVSAPSRAWVNVTVENYVKTAYAFNVQAAANFLDAGGFAQIVGDTNPNYKSNVPGSAQDWRGYPAGHSKAGQRIDPIVFVARVDDGLRYAASIHLRDRMLESGIQVNFLSMPSSSAFVKVMTARDYQIYSAGWTTGRFATYQWSWYHTSRWVPGGSNYHDSPTSPGYDLSTAPDKRPEDKYDIDYWASKVWYPPGLADAITAAKNVQSLATVKYATFIPLWGGKAFFYYRNLYGVTNQDGVGPENTYTFQSMVRADGGSTIRVGHKSPPTQVNQIYSSWVWDVTTMGQTMDGVYNLEPYNILNEQPGLAQDWTNAPGGPSAVPGTWVDPDDGKTKSYMRYWFLDDPNDGLGDKDGEWIKNGPSGGSVLADFTPHWLGGGYEFNCWYFDNEPAGWIYSGYRDIKHIECNLAGKYADVYFDVQSYWVYQWPWGRHIYAVEPASIDQSVLGWKSTPLSSQQTRSFAGPIAAGTYLHTLTPVSGAPIPKRTTGSPTEVIELRIDGALQTKATTPHLYGSTGAGGDYSIVGNSLNGPSIRIFKAVPAGSTLTVTYWARGDPAGYWPGNTNFQTTLIGTGQYYMTDFLAGAGGWATYKANPHNYMQTPPPGEIDWVYNWGAGTQPRSGNYALNIYDATYASAALGGSGNTVPTLNWLSPSDLTSPIGVTDVSDIGVLAASYGTVFSSTP
jgi:hypothetical protein